MTATIENKNNDISFSRAKKMVDTIYSLIKRLRKSHGYNDFLVFCESEKLTERGADHIHLEFEQELDRIMRSEIKEKSKKTPTSATKMRWSIEVICVYKRKILGDKPLSDLLKLLSCHSRYYIYNHRGHHRDEEHPTKQEQEQEQQWSYQELGTLQIIQDIGKGIDEVLGRDTSTLIFSTLRLVYKIKEVDIVSNPDVFVKKLTNLIGQDAFDPVSKQISKRLVEAVSKFS
jgi:hypothetical protein